MCHLDRDSQRGKVSTSFSDDRLLQVCEKYNEKCLQVGIKGMKLWGANVGINYCNTKHLFIVSVKLHGRFCKLIDCSGTNWSVEILKPVKFLLKCAFCKVPKTKNSIQDIFDANNMGNTILFLQNFDRPIGCRATDEFLDGRAPENWHSVHIRTERRVTLINYKWHLA